MELAQSRQAMAGSAAKPPASCGVGGGSGGKISKRGRRQQRRRALVDLTNIDSPITGLSLCEIPSPGTPGTPGSGEDLLRSQVKLLLQQVQGGADSLSAPPRGPLFGFHRWGVNGNENSSACGSWSSPGLVVAGPTPANTPSTVGGGEAEAAAAASIQSAINGISKITIAETVVSERPLADRSTTRSLDFDSLLDDADSVADEGQNMLPSAP